MNAANRRTALKVALEHIAFAVLDGQTPAQVLRDLDEPVPATPTWRCVEVALIKHWLQLDHDAARHDGARHDKARRGQGVVMSAQR
jgi:hypothetical protein